MQTPVPEPLIPWIVAAAIVAPIVYSLFLCHEALIPRMIRGGHVRTWHLETAVVATVGAAITLLAGDPWFGWVAWSGALFAHGSRSVGRRLYEAQARAVDDPRAVECWREQRRYSYQGIAAYAVLNFVLGMWGALASLSVGVGYDQWRQIYVARIRPWRERRRLRRAALPIARMVRH
jgi:O-antigen/teichoic acid export membrane protein